MNTFKWAGPVALESMCVVKLSAEKEMKVGHAQLVSDSVQVAILAEVKEVVIRCNDIAWAIKETLPDD